MAFVIVIVYYTNATLLIILLLHIFKKKMNKNNNIINIFTIYFINKGKIWRMIPMLDNVLMFPYYMNILVIELLIVKVSNK